MHKYEAMIIIRPDLPENTAKELLGQINDAVLKNNGLIDNSAIWSEKRRLTFPIKKCQEGVYYLVSFQAPPAAIKELRTAYKLNEHVLRVLITNIGG